MVKHFTPPVNPSFPLGMSEEPRVSVSKFGDGYAQRAPDGLNYEEATQDVKWKGLYPSEKDAILKFFRDRKGCEPFTCSFLNDGGAQWVCRSWSHDMTTVDNYEISAEFERDFSL